MVNPKAMQLHTGTNLAVAFTGVLQYFKITHKILLVTCDNASNNDRMVIEMSKRLIKFSEVNCTQCFTHIFNLVAKSLLKQFDAKLNHMNQLNDEDRHLLQLSQHFFSNSKPGILKTLIVIEY